MLVAARVIFEKVERMLVRAGWIAEAGGNVVREEEAVGSELA